MSEFLRAKLDDLRATHQHECHGDAPAAEPGDGPPQGDKAQATVPYSNHGLRPDR